MEKWAGSGACIKMMGNVFKLPTIYRDGVREGFRVTDLASESSMELADKLLLREWRLYCNDKGWSC